MEITWNTKWEPHMVVNKSKGVEYLTYKTLDEVSEVIHGFSTRIGGVSEGIFSSMNLSFTRGDDEKNVMENYRRFANAVGFGVEDIVTSDQTHTTNVHIVKEEDRGNGIIKPRPYKDIDGLITDIPGVVLATFYADCVPLFFVDPINKAIGLSHSGWRGTVNKIGEATVKKMKDTFGTDPENILAAIGPSICQDCYEVSEDVIIEFREAFDKKYWEKLFYKKSNGKYQLDLWNANRIIFMESGILEKNISMPGICTCCNPNYLYSHRASKGKRGNLGAFLGIRKI